MTNSHGRWNMAMAKKYPAQMVRCNACLRTTTHDVMFEHRTGEEDHVNHLFLGTDYQVLACRGCGNITYRTRRWSSDEQDEDGQIYRDSYYPPLVSRKKPEWFEKLPHNIQRVLKEVYIALDADSYYLATVGARTVVDLLMLDKIGDVGPFKAKIEKLVTAQHITKEEGDLVEAVIEAGNASAHRGYAPNELELKHVMDILEAILDKLYIADSRRKALAAQADALKKKIPRRPGSTGR